jgi:pantoate--beta-alanine ligase
MNKILFFVDIYKWLIDRIVFFTGGEVTIFFGFNNAELNVAHNYKGFMIIFKHASDLQKYLKRIHVAEHTIGFFPTMGALHAGHLSLLKKSKQICGISVASIFVNPTQFNNIDDFKKYPKKLEQDIQLLEENDCDILFLPDEKEIYPDETSKNKYLDLGYVEKILEGKFRPGHFQGVAIVVEKLLNIVEPDFLFLGQKDFQQCMIIKRLIFLMGKKTEVVVCSIVRQGNGLAMSSRNLRLSKGDQQVASNLYVSLVSIKENCSNESFATLKRAAEKILQSKGFTVEYLELAKSENLELLSEFIRHEQMIILVAAFFNEVRLIDNLLIDACN